MSFGLARGRPLHIEGVGLTRDDLPPLPDDLTRPDAAWLDVRAWFPHPDRPLEIEIGSGKGAFLVEQAARLPDVNFLGIEWAREFFAYAADRMRRRGLENVRMLHDDAVVFMRWRVPHGVARVIHLYFSDPWPKARHHKRRVVQDEFLAQAHRVLQPGGELRIVTDHADYWAWMEERFERWCDAASARDRDGRWFERVGFDDSMRAAGAREGEIVGTNFERKYAREGRPFHATALRKPLDS